MGATFALTESIVANQRQKDDALNGVAGGCAAGFLVGIKCALSYGGTYALSLNQNILSALAPHGRSVLCSAWCRRRHF